MSAEQLYLFRHVLLREAAYQLMLPSLRARLHLFALRLLDDGQQDMDLLRALELAEHARRAGEGADESLREQLRSDELRFSLVAADQANQRQQNNLVLSQTRRALELAGADAKSRSRAFELMAQAALRAGLLPDALEAERGRLQTAHTDEQRLEACLGAAHISNLLGEKDSAREFTDRAESLANRCASPRLAMSLWNHRSRMAYYAGDFGLAVECNTQAEAAGRDIGLSRQHLAVKANRQLYLSSLGRHEEALACARQAAELATQASDPDMLAFIKLYHGHTLMEMRHWRAAVQTLADAERAARRAGARMRIAESAYRRGLSSVAIDDLHAALEAMRTVVRIAREVGSGDLLRLGVQGHAIVLRASGRYEEALTVCEDGMAELKLYRTDPSELIQLERATASRVWVPTRSLLLRVRLCSCKRVRRCSMNCCTEAF